MPEKSPVSDESGMAKLEARINDLEVLVRQNIQWSEVVYKDVKKIRRRLFTMQLWGWVKLFLLLAPVIAAAIFLPPYYREAKDWYQNTVVAPQEKLQNNVNSFLKFIPGANTSTRH